MKKGDSELSPSERSDRNRDIIAARKAGIPAKQIAEEFKLTRKHIYEILSNHGQYVRKPRGPRIPKPPPKPSTHFTPQSR